MFFLVVMHDRQEGDKAWTFPRVAAFRRTAACLCIVWLMLEACIQLRVGQIYSEMKSLRTMLLEAFVYLLVEDALYYWSHRLLHLNKWAYRHIHLMHHESQSDVSLMHGLHMTFAELGLSILLPGLLPLLVVPFQGTLFRIYSFVSIFGVICNHGLDVFPHSLMPFPLNGVEGHLLHHQRLMGNYSGPLSLWDYLCGTHMRAKRISVDEIATPPSPAPREPSPPPSQRVSPMGNALWLRWRLPMVQFGY